MDIQYVLNKSKLILFQDLVAHFVSLIPIMPEALDENNGFDIWMTSEVSNYNLQFKCIMFAFLVKKYSKILCTQVVAFLMQFEDI